MNNNFTKFLFSALVLAAVAVLLLGGNHAEARPVAFAATPVEFVLGKLPKAPVPPSGSSDKTHPEPPSDKFVFGKLPKGPVPPSGSSNHTNPFPPSSGKFVLGKMLKAPLPPRN